MTSVQEKRRKECEIKYGTPEPGEMISQDAIRINSILLAPYAVDARTWATR
jgi:hypothetical protein